MTCHWRMRRRTWKIAPCLVVAITMPLMCGGCGGSQGASTSESAHDHEPGAAASANAEAPPWFADEARRRGVGFVYQSGHRERYLMPEIMGGGAALFDMDNDGDLDLYCVQAGRCLDDQGNSGKSPPNQLFRNRGDGAFDDVTGDSGADDRGYGMGVAAGDYDNDGDVDLYVTNVGPNALLQNNGHGHFTNVSVRARVDHSGWGASAAFLDYDHDGDLDLFVCNYLNWSAKTELNCSMLGGPDYCSPKNYHAPVPDVLYRNNGNGTFTDVTHSLGVDASFGTGLGVACGDFTGDGRTDVFVANDGMHNQLWLNRGASFEDVAMAYGCAADMQGVVKAGMGVSAEDIDDDGDLDILVGNLSTETDSLYRNQGRYFEDSTAAVGLAAVSRSFTRFGLGWQDFDNDGWLDLYEANGRVVRKTQLFSDDPYAEPNVLLRGWANGKLVEVKPRGGTRDLLCHTSRAAAFGDIDNDGGIDIVVINRHGPAYVLRNIVANRGHWIKLRVVEEHGRDAFGAKVTLRLGERLITREVRSAYSYCAANDPRVHIGLGDQTEAREVQVRWVDGARESFGNLPADAIVILRRGAGTSLPAAPLESSR